MMHWVRDQEDKHTHTDTHTHTGEAFDKVARLLSIDPKPSGGAALELLAKEGDPQRFK